MSVLGLGSGLSSKGPLNTGYRQLDDRFVEEEKEERPLLGSGAIDSSAGSLY